MIRTWVDKPLREPTWWRLIVEIPLAIVCNCEMIESAQSTFGMQQKVLDLQWGPCQTELLNT